MGKALLALAVLAVFYYLAASDDAASVDYMTAEEIKKPLVAVRAAPEHAKRLPARGYDFVPRRGESAGEHTVGPDGGYIDRFGNEWVPLLFGGKKGATGEPQAWRVHLSRDGKIRMGRGDDVLIITPSGKTATISGA